MGKHILIILITLFLARTNANGQNFAVKTNLLYGGVTLTPNLGAEIGLGKKTTLELYGSLNPWNIKGSDTDNKKLAHWAVQPAFRYWFCESFNGQFIGLHALYGEYNISGHDIPLWFNGKVHKEFRYQGNAIGGGISYGYGWLLSNRINLEFELGIGYVLLHYDKFNCQKCGNKIGNERKNYFGPTKASVGFVYLIR